MIILSGIGTITDMIRISRTGLLLAAGLWLAAVSISCAGSEARADSPIAEASSNSPVMPTRTPFQVQDSLQNPYLQTSIPLVEATFTPYPLGRVPQDGFATPAQILSPTDSAALNSINPLTGLPAPDPALLERRPMAIKVANAPDYVRPQSGLTLADVVFEYYIEWGDTRFIAVMYSNDSPMVGPVRSGRYFDEHVARMYNAFLVFKFADPRELSYLKNSTLNEFLVVPGAGACPPYVFGYPRREDYNNFFFNTLKWANCAAKRNVDNLRPNLRNGFFAEEAPQSPIEATRIYFRYSAYSYNYWEYNASQKKYLRYQESQDMIRGRSEAYAPLYDAQTSQQVNTENLVVLFVPHTFANQFNAEDEVYNIDLLGSGNAYVFRDGIVLPAQWNRTDENQPLLLTTLLGEPIFLRPGRTFFQVLGVTSPYSQNGTDWKFIFQTP